MRFGTWLRDIRAKEREAGVNHRDLASRPAELTSYVQDHLSQALRKLELMYTQIPPAPIPEDRLRIRWESFRGRYIRDIRYALDHIGAALTAVGCTEEELAAVGQLVKVVPLGDGSKSAEEIPAGEKHDTDFVNSDAASLPVSCTPSSVDHETEK